MSEIRFVSLFRLIGRLEGSAICTTVDKDELDEMLIIYESQGEAVSKIDFSADTQKIEIGNIGWFYSKNLSGQESKSCSIKN